MFWVMIGGKIVLGPGKQYFAELRTDCILSVHMIIQSSSQQVWELNFHA